MTASGASFDMTPVSDEESHRLARARDEFLKLLLSGNRRAVLKFSNAFLANGNSVKDLYELVMRHALYEVGRLWEQNKITVAAEHMATALSESVLNALYSSIIPEQYSDRKVVLACVENEEHQVGIKMVADIFELNNWESFFLGTGFPTSELIKYIDEIQPDLIALSASIYFNFGKLKQMLTELCERFPSIPILIGGQALLHVSENLITEFPQVVYLSDLNEIETYINNFE